jgi:hypothetical protein
MQEFNDFLGVINQHLHTKEKPRLESMLMPANFSSIVSEFISSSIPKHYPAIVKNRYHNGHPDLVPAGHYPGDSVRHGDEGIEIKGSRNLRGWQGHNPEDTWLMVFIFDSNRPDDEGRGIEPKPYRFIMVVGERLVKADWLYAGRSETSRRTITASVTRSGYEKMMSNWIYKDPCYISKRTGSLSSA